MKPPIKAIKKIIKFCKSKNVAECDKCELEKFCSYCLISTPDSYMWEDTYKELKEGK